MMVIGHCFVFGNLSIQLLGNCWVKSFYIEYQDTKFGSSIDELSGLFVDELTEVPIACSRTIFYPLCGLFCGANITAKDDVRAEGGGSA